MRIINVMTVFNMDIFPETVLIHTRERDLERMEVGGMMEVGML